MSMQISNSILGLSLVGEGLGLGIGVQVSGLVGKVSLTSMLTILLHCSYNIRECVTGSDVTKT